MKPLQVVAVGIVIALVMGVSPALAQTVRNPTKVEFTPSPDHAQVTSYEIGWFLGAATDPVSTVDLAKPIPDAANLCTAVINVMPLPFNEYTAKIRAKAGTVASEWSLASNPFQRVPGPPAKPVVK